MAESAVDHRHVVRRRRSSENLVLTRRPRWRPQGILGLAAVLPALAIVGLLFLVLWTSVRVSVRDGGFTLAHFRAIFSDSLVGEALVNTAGFAAVTLVTSFAIGVPIAWLAERTDLPGRKVIHTLMTVSVFIPSFFIAMGWVFLLHPRFGMLNRWLMDLFGLDQGPLDIINVPGMGFVQGLGLVPLVFIFVSASFRTMDSALEESAAMCGARPLTVFRRVVIPLAYPGLCAAGLFVLTSAISSFDIPLVMGMTNRIYTFSTFLLVASTGTSLDGVPHYGLVAAFATIMIAVATILSFGYARVLLKAKQYEVVSGKGYRQRVVTLGRKKWLAWLFIGGYFVVAKLLPLLLTLWASLVPYFQPVSRDAFRSVSLDHYRELPWPLVRRGLEHTFLMMLIAPLIVVAFSLLYSWIVLRTRSRFRVVLDYVSFLPNAIPSSIFGFSVLIAALYYLQLPFGLDLYGSLALLIIVHVITGISFGTRIVTSGLIQIHSDLESAAKMSGANGWQLARRVIVPMLRPTVVYLWLWLALLIFRELTLATLLVSPDNVTVSVITWNLWSTGQMGQASALNLIMMLVLMPLVALAWRYGRGDRIGTR